MRPGRSAPQQAEDTLMQITRRHASLGALSLFAGTSISTAARAGLGELTHLGEGLEDFWLATDAYIYGYPLVTMETTRRVLTNVTAPDGDPRADGANHQDARISQR